MEASRHRRNAAVYERRNQEKQGVKVQLFAINEAKNGLGRVYDSRPEFGTRTFSGGLKFPLGYWQQGETRQLEEKRYEGAKVETRIESITITQLDFNYQGAPHCLEFYWVYKDGGKIVDHQTYTYCPNRGMVRAIQHKADAPQSLRALIRVAETEATIRIV